jgi:hypothetical protein
MTEGNNSGQGSTFTPTKLLLTLGGLAAAIASIYGVWQILFPPPPATASGELSDVTVDSGSGFVNVSFEAVIEGYSGQQCEVRWTLYDANSRAVFPDSDFQDQHATYIVPSRNRDEGTAEFQVPDPGRPGNYYVRIELLPPEESDENLALDQANSEVFVGGSPADGQYSS